MIVSIPLSIFCSIVALWGIGAVAQHDDARRPRAWPSASWSTTRRWRSRTFTATSACASRCARDPRRRAADRGAGVRRRRSPSASCSCRSLFLTGPVAVPVRAAGAGGRLRDDGVATCSRGRSVPTMVLFLLKREAGEHRHERRHHGDPVGDCSAGSHARFERGFEGYVRSAYLRVLGVGIGASRGDGRGHAGFRGRVAGALALVVGRDFFPTVDARPVSSARARPRRHAASKRPSGCSGGVENAIRRDRFPTRNARRFSTTSACRPVLHQHGVHRQRHSSAPPTARSSSR